MATLYERLVDGGDETKIPIHGLVAMMRDVKLGNLTVADIIAAFSLTASQQTDAQTLYTAFNTAGDSDAFMGKIFSHLAGAEIGLHSYYTTEANFWTKVNA